MTTPIYKGRGQPVGSGGLFGNLGGLFGVTTPSYAGQGQPGGSSSGYLGGTSPAYKPAPKPTTTAPTSAAGTSATGTSTTSKATSDGSASATATSGAPDDAACDAMPPYPDPCGIPSGPIAIVIPRDLRGLIE